MVQIGKLKFKNAEEFKEYADEKMADFLENIQELEGYTYPTEEESLFAYEEGITFYYTRRGSELVENWIRRMNMIFEKYFPEDWGFDPKCVYWKTF